MKKALDVLSSRRVSVYLFLILLFVSLLVALIPQKELPAYYEARGCTTTSGIPTDAKLDELGIRDVVGSCATALLNKYGQ